MDSNSHYILRAPLHPTTRMVTLYESSDSKSWSSISHNLFDSDSDRDAASIDTRQGSDLVVSSSRTRATRIDRLFENLFYVSYNEMSLKVLGSKRKIAEELKRQKDCKNLVIHPCSKFR